ncbi:MAG: DUF2680 domain-containing protein [Dethiobacter sp.]|nr:DUF2680 domain-containing protein [Dethiobacter sp.]MBS3901906.1 DUF2680 domain-containing protein [Dethiobacter sp.]
MKRSMLIALMVALVLALAVPSALALNDNQKVELEKLYEQQHQLRLQILETQVEVGLVETEDANLFKERMQERWEAQKQRMTEGDYSFGFGRGGGKGRGFGGRGCGNCPVAEEAPAL